MSPGGSRSSPRLGPPEAVMLVGPASPRDLAPLFTGRDRAEAERIAGYRGIPVSELARSLVAAGLEVELATTAQEVETPITLEGDRFRLHLAPMRPRARDRALDAFRRERQWLRQIVKASAAPLVHAHWTYEFAWAALGANRPVIVTAHDAPLTILRHCRDPYRAVRTVMAYAVRLRIRTLTAVSPYLAGRWRREMGWRGEIHVIPNSAPVLPSGYAAVAHGSGRRLVDVADSGSHKNIAALVRAFRMLRDTRPDVQLDLVGAGLANGDPLPGALGREGSCSGIRFHGLLNRERLAVTLASAHAFVHPSREECCSMAVLEAMAMGLPVVAGVRAGGTPWMLDHGRAGVLVDIEDPEAIAQALARLLDDDHALREFGRRARQRVQERFSASTVCSEYLDVYARVMAEAA